MPTQSKNTRTKPFVKFIKDLGPGIITGASDDDPSGIATYSQAGAQFGFATLWMALITFPLMLVIQEMCARIGMVSSKGLTQNIKDHYSRTLLYFIAVLMAPAIVFNIAADIASMGAVAHLVFPLLPAGAASIFFTLVLMVAIIYLPYQKIEAALKYCCLSLFLYIIVPFLVNEDWTRVLKNTFVPDFHFNKDYVSIIVAILGTTISPYMFFWQATMGAEENKNDLIKSKKKPFIKKMRYDVFLGMLLSNIVMYFIILATGSVLFQHGIQNIATVEQAAKALEPLAGELSYLLFALGVIGTGALAVPVLTGALAYMLATLFNWKNGLDKTFYQAKGFYAIVIIAMILALLIEATGINPIKALIWTAIAYGITAPILIFLILHIANNKKIMKQCTNSTKSNVLGGIAFLFMFIAAVLFLYFQFLGS